MEYVFIQGGERLDDPFNPRRITNGMGKYNQYFHMPEYQPTSLVHRSPRVPSGRVTIHTVETHFAAQGKQRTLYIYQPPVEGPVTLVMVWDGNDYNPRARLNIII
jgi:enterochelin esterase-like enzyme